MTCQTPHPHLFLYLDNELGESERHAFEHHLPRCQVCQEVLSHWQKQREMLALFPKSTAPAGMTARILEGVESYQVKQVSFLESMLPMLRYAAPVFSVFAVCLWVFQLWSVQPMPQAQRISSATDVTRSMLFGQDDSQDAKEPLTALLLGGD